MRLWLLAGANSVVDGDPKRSVMNFRIYRYLNIKSEYPLTLIGSIHQVFTRYQPSIYNANPL